MLVQTGNADVVLVAGVESMSNIEYYSTDLRWGARAGSVSFHDRLQRGRERSQPEARFGYISGMPETAENVGREYGITREEADAFAVRSHQRAAAAWEAGRFDAEVVPIEVPQRKGPALSFARDEGIRPDTTLAAWPNSNRPRGRHRDGRQCQSAERCRGRLPGRRQERLAALGLTPLAWLHSWAAVGCHPATMGIGPVPAVRHCWRATVSASTISIWSS